MSEQNEPKNDEKNVAYRKAILVSLLRDARLSYEARGVAGDNGVRLDIFRHHAPRADDGPVANRGAG